MPSGHVYARFSFARAAAPSTDCLLIYCTPYSQPYCACWLNTFGAYLLCVAFVAVAGRRYTYTVCTYLLTYFAEHQVSKYRRELSAMRL